MADEKTYWVEGVEYENSQETCTHTYPEGLGAWECFEDPLTDNPSRQSFFCCLCGIREQELPKEQWLRLFRQEQPE